MRKFDTNYSWDKFYLKEIENFERNEQDTGENWFDDCGAEEKVIEFLFGLIEDRTISPQSLLLDLGTGNGHFLFEVYNATKEEELETSMLYTGIDYSPESIQFAKQIATRKFSEQKFEFYEVDFIKEDCAYLAANKEKFDIIFDKGTLDAIALNNNPIDGFGGKIGTEIYPLQVSQLMHSGSLLIITSCNFTEEELIKIITSNGSNSLIVWDKIKYPTFQFGGQKGSTICSIAFIKK